MTTWSWHLKKFEIEIFRFSNFHTISNENFENFKIEKFRNLWSQKFSLKIVWKWKFVRSTFFENFRSQNFSDVNFKLLQLLSFSIKLFDFFIDPCKFSVRSECRYLEVSFLHPERIKRVLYYLLSNPDRKYRYPK